MVRGTSRLVERRMFLVSAEWTAAGGAAIADCCLTEKT